MKKILVLVFLMASMASFGQKKDKTPFRDRLVFSGDIALSFSNFGSILGANPTVGYRVNDWLTSGLGVHYYYFSNNGFSNNLYGGQLFTRAEIFDGAFLITELQQTNTRVRIFDTQNEEFITERRWVPQWYVGGGYYQNLGGNVRIGGSILIDLIDDLYSPWDNPQIRGGIIIGI